MIKIKMPERNKGKQKVYMVAIIEKGGSVICIGHNRYDRRSYRYKKRNKYTEREGLHAEMDAILKTNKTKLKRAVMTIFGVNKNGNQLKNTHPCSHCMPAIRAVGIKKIRFIKNGEWAETRIKKGVAL